MEIREGSSDVPLYIKPRVNGAVITVTAWEALYGGTTGVYTLEGETKDKLETVSITGTDDANGVLFTLPSTMFDESQKIWTMVMKFVINGITDKSLYNFEIKVAKGDSPESR